MRTIQLLLMSIVLLASCSKSTPTSTTQLKLIGKWDLKSFVAKDFLGTEPRSTSGNYRPGDYIQIELDGTCYFKLNNVVTKTTWKLLNDEKTIFFEEAGSLDLSEDGYEIVKLDDNDMELLAREGTGQYISEVTLYLEK